MKKLPVLASAFLMLAFWGALFALAFPWEWVPPVHKCHQVPIKGILGNVKGYKQLCGPSYSAQHWTIALMFLWSLGMSLGAAFVAHQVVKKSLRA